MYALIKLYRIQFLISDSFWYLQEDMCCVTDTASKYPTDREMEKGIERFNWNLNQTHDTVTQT